MSGPEETALAVLVCLSRAIGQILSVGKTARFFTSIIEMACCCQGAAARLKKHCWCESAEQQAKLKLKGASPLLFLQTRSRPPLVKPNGEQLAKGTVMCRIPASRSIERCVGAQRQVLHNWHSLPGGKGCTLLLSSCGSD